MRRPFFCPLGIRRPYSSRPPSSPPGPAGMGSGALQARAVAALERERPEPIGPLAFPMSRAASRGP
jgi:hypothetical protein